MSELSENIEAKREERAKLRELEQAATPGPWNLEEPYAGYCAIKSGDVFVVHTATGGCERPQQDHALIVAARNALPGLLEEIERLERERDESRANAARLRVALETVTRELEATHYYEQKDVDQSRAILAETPAESLEAVRQKAYDHLAYGIINGLTGLGAGEAEKLLYDHIEAVCADAGRERAVRELRLVRQRIPKLCSWDDIVNAVTDRAAEIAKEGA